MSSHLSIAGMFNRLHVIVWGRSARVSGCEKDIDPQEARVCKRRGAREKNTT